MLPGTSAAWEWLGITVPSQDLWEDNLSISTPALSEHCLSSRRFGVLSSASLPRHQTQRPFRKVQGWYR